MKIFGAPTTTPFQETKEKDLQINCYQYKDFEAPRIDEDNLTFEEQAVIQFFLQSFGKKHFNIKGIVGLGTEAARKYLGSSFSFQYLPHFYICASLLTYVLFVDEMALKSIMAEF